MNLTVLDWQTFSARNLRGKHDGCWYFVLDPQHDPHARIALAAYAVDCAPHYPKLAEDLRKVLGKVTNG